MPSAERAEPLSDSEAAALFSHLADLPAILIAVSGGPDSVALLVLLARWRASLSRGPRLTAITVDHGMRPESRQEAAAVKTLAASLGVPHRVVRWRGDRPVTRVQEAAREARYRLLAKAARSAGATDVLTAHTLDDQAETILFRLARGSGLAGLMGMMAHTPVPVAGETDIMLVRPLLTIPKSRLIATLRSEGIPYADDPTNRDPRFTRARIRALMPKLAAEGLTAARLALLASRVEQAETALWKVAHDRVQELSARWPPQGRVKLAAAPFFELPEAIAVRAMYIAIASIGHEDPIQLRKLEALVAALRAASPVQRVRRTLAGDIVTLQEGLLTVERAPARRNVARTTGKGRSPGTPRLRETT